MAYVIAKGGYQEIKLGAGDDTYDFSQITGHSQAQISWLNATKTGSAGFFGNFSYQDIKKIGVTLAPYQMMDPYGDIDTIVLNGTNPPNLTFWSGPPDDYISFEGNYTTGVIWNLMPSSGNDTVVGGNNNATVDFFNFTNLRFTLAGDQGYLNLGPGSSLTYENVNSWRLWSGSYTVKTSENDENFEIWGSSVNLDLSSGGSDFIHFSLWNKSNVTVSGLNSDDAFNFNVADIKAYPLGLQYDSAANTTKFQVKKSSNELVNVTLNGAYQIDRIQDNKIYFTGTGASSNPAAENTGTPSTTAPTYALRSSAASVNEGSSVNFILTTTGVERTFWH
jgi:hypothetical protein